MGASHPWGTQRGSSHEKKDPEDAVVYLGEDIPPHSSSDDSERRPGGQSSDAVVDRSGEAGVLLHLPRAAPLLWVAPRAAEQPGGNRQGSWRSSFLLFLFLLSLSLELPLDLFSMCLMSSPTADLSLPRLLLLLRELERDFCLLSRRLPPLPLEELLRDFRVRAAAEERGIVRLALRRWEP